MEQTVTLLIGESGPDEDSAFTSVKGLLFSRFVLCTV